MFDYTGGGYKIVYIFKILYHVHECKEVLYYMCVYDQY